LTLTNNGGAGATGIAVAVTAPFSRSGGSCGTTLAAGANCTIGIVYSPGTGVTTSSGTATITASVAVSGSPVSLNGTAVPRVVSATLTPTTWSTSASRGVGAGFLCLGGGPCQSFTLTNTGNVPLTGIAQAVLGGTSPADYGIVRILSTCGPTGGGQIIANTTLNPGATCNVQVQFLPRSTDPANSVRNATVSVTDAAGTQTSTLSGTAR
jgi:hypothetical protein